MNQIAIFTSLVVMLIVIHVESYFLPHLRDFTVFWYYMLPITTCFIFCIWVGYFDKSEVVKPYHIPLTRCISWMYELIFLSGGTVMFVIGVLFYGIDDVIWLAGGGYSVSLVLKILFPKKLDTQ